MAERRNLAALAAAIETLTFDEAVQLTDRFSGELMTFARGHAGAAVSALASALVTVKLLTQSMRPLREVLEAQRARIAAIEKAMDMIIPWVFVHDNGEQIRDFRDAWRNACKDAGVAGRLVHDFRRTAVRNLERAGIPRSAAMKLTGQKTEAVYRRYAIVSEGDLREAGDKLAALHAGEKGMNRKVVALRGAP